MYGLSAGRVDREVGRPEVARSVVRSRVAAETNADWPCAANSRNASSNAASYAGVSSPEGTAAATIVSDSPQLAETVAAVFGLAAVKNASANPASVFGAW